MNLTELQIQALTLMQALLGVISPNFRMVWISIPDEVVVVGITLELASEEDFEEIEDLKTEFEALQAHGVDYEFNTRVSADILTWPDEDTIVVYRRRE